MKNWFDDSSTYERVLRYLKQCPDEDYDQLIEKVNEFWFSFAAREERAAINELSERIKKAEAKSSAQSQSRKESVER